VTSALLPRLYAMPFGTCLRIAQTVVLARFLTPSSEPLWRLKPDLPKQLALIWTHEAGRYKRSPTVWAAILPRELLDRDRRAREPRRCLARS